MNTWKLIYKEPEYINSGVKGFTTYQSDLTRLDEQTRRKQKTKAKIGEPYLHKNEK